MEREKRRREGREEGRKEGKEERKRKKAFLPLELRFLLMSLIHCLDSPSKKAAGNIHKILLQDLCFQNTPFLHLDFSPSMKLLSGQKRKVFEHEQCKGKAKNQGGFSQIPSSSMHKVLGSVDPLAPLLWPQSCGQFCWCLALLREDILLRAVGRLRIVK